MISLYNFLDKKINRKIALFTGVISKLDFEESILLDRLPSIV
jgi:hypothetical protein